jgi:hypothetical protein
MIVQTEYNFVEMLYMDASRRPRTIAVALAAACACAGLRTAASPATPGTAGREACTPDAACIVLEYEETVAAEARQLADALRLRVSSYGVRVIAEPAAREGATTAEAISARGGAGRPRLFWIVHLRQLSKELLLVAVDNQVGAGAEDVVREVARGETEASTVWTMALMIEEFVSPYFAKGEDVPALGAGLAIIEPPAVGGISARGEPPRPQFPKFRFFGVGVLVLGVVSAGVMVAGPIVSVEGAFAPRFLASFSAGWAGVGSFAKADVRGRVQYVPLEIGMGYAMYASRAVELSGWTGLAIGFAAYTTRSEAGDEPQRTDILFEPGALAALRLSFAIYGPLSCYLRGGVAVPFVHDRLVSQGSGVFEAGWITPGFEVGLHFRI